MILVSRSLTGPAFLLWESSMEMLIFVVAAALLVSWLLGYRAGLLGKMIIAGFVSISILVYLVSLIPIVLWPLIIWLRR